MNPLAFLTTLLFAGGMLGLFTLTEEDERDLKFWMFYAMPIIGFALLLRATFPGGWIFNAFSISFSVGGGANIIQIIIVLSFGFFLILIGHFREFELLDYAVGLLIFIVMLAAIL